MNSKYTCRTSLGEVEILFDPLDNEVRRLYAVSIVGHNFDCVKNFEWIKGQEFVEELYDYNPDDVHIIISNGLFWLRVQLRDPYYGAPEYLLTAAGESDQC